MGLISTSNYVIGLINYKRECTCLTWFISNLYYSYVYNWLLDVLYNVAHLSIMPQINRIPQTVALN